MPEEQKKSPSDRYYYILAFRIAGDLAITIVIPALIAAYVGVKIDERLDSSPWALVIALVIAFLLTAYIVVKKARYYQKLYEHGPKQKQK
ncbi:AtpZ/AtpI family protein [Patescibacteria group bacterium]|nr:AtpZ/AtpI family protein [Patescibacteria group bacterium]